MINITWFNNKMNRFYQPLFEQYVVLIYKIDLIMYHKHKGVLNWCIKSIFDAKLEKKLKQ